MAKIIAAKKSSIGVSCFIIRHANHPATASTSSHQKYQYVNPTNYINQTGGYVQIKWAELSSSNFPSSTPSRMNNQSSAITRPQAERMREHPGGQAARLLLFWPVGWVDHIKEASPIGDGKFNGWAGRDKNHVAGMTDHFAAINDDFQSAFNNIIYFVVI